MSLISTLLSCFSSSCRHADITVEQSLIDNDSKFQTTIVNSNPPKDINYSFPKVILTTSNGSAVLSPYNVDSNVNITTHPDYIPVNAIEVAKETSNYSKGIVLSDVEGDILYKKRIEINYKGITGRKRKAISFEERSFEMIKTTNYFWIKRTNDNILLINSNSSQKDFILNYANNNCELSSNYIFMICYIKEINQYKIKFNDMISSDILKNQISIEVSSVYPMPLPKEAFIKLQYHTIAIKLISKCLISLIIDNQKYVYHSISSQEITLGRNTKCTICINDIDSIHCTIYYDECWKIKDGYNDTHSILGTYIYTSYPLYIYDDMHIKLFDREIVINETQI